MLTGSVLQESHRIFGKGEVQLMDQIAASSGSQTQGSGVYFAAYRVYHGRYHHTDAQNPLGVVFGQNVLVDAGLG